MVYSNVGEMTVGRTPLSGASLGGHLETVQLLLDSGALVDKADMGGATALFWAASRNKVDVVRTLIAHGASVDQADNKGLTPLISACCWNSIDAAKALLEGGAAVNATTKNGESPLYCACENGFQKLALYLIDHGADVNQARKDGITPLISSISTQPNKGCPRTIGTRPKNRFVHSHVHATVIGEPIQIGGHEDLACEVLIPNGASVNQIDKEGTSPLSFACKEDMVNLTRALIAGGADANLANKYEETPLYFACLHGCVQVARQLIDNGAVPLHIPDGTPRAIRNMLKKKSKKEMMEWLSGME
eukprot:TRINITY_DN374_c1_g1_i1.p1 TRINITY_DN374_c1_g1~~TRINITY_DN374_c1_g1_i1.p1  ORF type:complete len:304 (-),score=66.54 TRINITY_DN374_c1_g1_i1:290-1201(-)